MAITTLEQVGETSKRVARTLAIFVGLGCGAGRGEGGLSVR